MQAFYLVVLILSLSCVVNGLDATDAPSVTQWHPSGELITPDGLRWVSENQLGKNITGTRPKARIWHTVGLYTKNNTDPETNITTTTSHMLVLGGWDMKDTVYNDLWQFNVSNFAWTLLQPDELVPANQTRPMRNRLAQSAVTPDQKYFIVYGGSGMEILTPGVVHILDIESMTWLEPVSEANHNGPIPPARAAHTFVYSAHLDGYMVYAGGANISLISGTPTLKNDLWVYQWRDKQWTELSNDGPPRFGHSCACNANGTIMYMYGGSQKGALDPSGLQPEIYAYFVLNNTWALLTSSSPRTLAGQWMFFFEPTNSLVMIPFIIAKDNIDFTGLVSNTTFRYSIDSNSWFTVNTTGTIREYLAWFSCVLTSDNLMVLFAGVTSAIVSHNNMYFIQLGKPSDYDKFDWVPATKQDLGDDRGVNSKVLAGALVPSFVVLAAIVGGAIFFVSRHRRNARRMALFTADNPTSNQTDYFLLADRNQIKDIEIKERLGGGNFGDVYKGLWQGTTAVACKSLKSEDQMGDFLREASTLKSLTHPNVVQFLGIFVSTTGEKYMVTEYLSLGSLNQLLIQQQKKLQPIDLLGMCKHVSAGMRYISEQKQLVHRDLALRNLLVTLQENKYLVKIADLGLTRRVGDDGLFVSKETTIPIKWTSPEAIQSGHWGPKSDIWSMGIVMWELFSYGSTPYPTMANSEVLPRILEGYRMSPPMNMPDELTKLMLRCWQLDPKERPSFKELHEEIDQILQKLFLSLSPEAALGVNTNMMVAPSNDQGFYEASNVFYSPSDNYSNYANSSVRSNNNNNNSGSNDYYMGGAQIPMNTTNSTSHYATPQNNNHYNA